MRNKKIVIGNWKMNPSSLKEAVKLLSDINKGLKGIKKTEVAVCVPSLFLSELRKKSKKISIGAQNAFGEEKGAYTGEVSPPMLESLGVKYVILGHSERRAMGETSKDINKKIKSALSAGLVPILCVGESERDEDHGYFGLVKAQIEECLEKVSKNSISKIIIAYEPVWALSTTPGRRDATASDCREMVIFIRKVLSDKFGSEVSKMRIIYGGSVNEKDSSDFLVNGGVDGLLPGRASLTAKKFIEIIKTCEALKN